MRPYLLLALFSLCTAAELEQITTTDGRRLVGTYDEAAGTMTLDGPGAAVIKLRPRDVKSRDAFVRAEAPAKAVPDASHSAVPVKLPDEKLTDAFRAVTEAHAAADEAERLAVVAWLRANDLEPVPVPTLGSDPRESERAAVERANQENGRRFNLRRALTLHDAVAAGSKKDRSDAAGAMNNAIFLLRKELALSVRVR